MMRWFRTLRAIRGSNRRLTSSVGLALMASIIAVLLTSVGVWAYFTSIGSGNSSATVSTLSVPGSAAASASGGGVTVTWTASKIGSTVAATSYTVERYSGTGTDLGAASCSPVPSSAGVPNALGNFSCADSPGPGTFKYKITGRYNLSWTATTGFTNSVSPATPTSTPTATPTVTNTPTATPIPPTATFTPTPTSTFTPTATFTPTPTPTNTPTPSTFIERDTAADTGCRPELDGTGYKLLTTTAAGAQLSKSIPNSTNGDQVLFSFTTDAGVPNKATWASGTYVIKLDSVVMGSRLDNYKVQVLRVGSTCGSANVLVTSTAQTGTGSQTITLTGVAASSGVASDRLQIRVLGSASQNGSGRSLTITVNTAAAAVTVPW